VAVRNFPTEVKIKVVFEVLIGEEIKFVAAKYNTSRQSIYTWMKKIRKILSQELILEGKGYQFKKVDLDISSQRKEKEIKKLKQLLSNAERKIDRLERTIRLPDRLNGRRPKKCPHCGCQKVYKNGTYKKVSKNHLPLVVIQKFICAYCKNSISSSENKNQS